MILIDIFNGKQAVSTLGRYLSYIPSIEVEDSHAHRRYLYARECCRRETSRQRCSNAGPPSSMVTYVGPASAWRLVVSCANPVLHPDLTHSVLSQFVQGSSQIEKHGFFLTLIRLIFVKRT